VNDEIVLERKGQVGSVTLRRPKALNALTQPMVVDLDARLHEWAADAAVAAVVVRGAAREDGKVPFCAGGDIRLLYGERDDPDRHFAVVFYAQEYRLNTLIHRFPKPYVALIDGVVMGGGVGVSIHGSHRVMTERTLFAMPETGIGLFPDVGATHFFPRLPGKAGLYLGLTGARIGAADALYLGLATHTVPSERLPALDEALLAADFSGDATTEIDRIIAENASDLGPAPLAAHQAELDRCFSAGSVEEIVARLDAEGTDWSREAVETLRQKSPTSLKVAFKQLTEYNDLDFEAAMALEYRLAMHCNLQNDFFEGIRAQIIDKDRQPKWQPARLEDVTAARVDGFFDKPPKGDMTF
jgi:enoyl-CoA hydratase